MMSIKKVESSKRAASYFDKDDYYTRDSSPSAWLGTGAAKIDLSGEVSKDKFERILEGWITDEQRLGNNGRRTDPSGAWEHTPGWDMTFSAPKSVSILAEVIGDERIIAAHDEAVAAAIAYTEGKYAVTRAKEGSRVAYVNTGNLTVAAFRHDVSRELEPQLHTHAVVANATMHDGKWMSLHSRPLYAGKMDIGLYYRQELALRLAALGYEIERSAGGMFEIAGVSEHAKAVFSTRSAQIEEYLGGIGLTRETATSEQISAAAIYTRSRKRAFDRDTLTNQWREDLTRPEALKLEALEAAARQRAVLEPIQAEAKLDSARKAVGRAVEILQERRSAFAYDDLVETGSMLAVGTADRAAIVGAVHDMVGTDLLPREVVQPDRITRQDASMPGYNTEKTRSTEDRMLRLLTLNSGNTTQIAKRGVTRDAINFAAKAARANGHDWNKSQRDATELLLTSRDRFVGVQGYAGGGQNHYRACDCRESRDKTRYRCGCARPHGSFCPGAGPGH